MSFLYWLESIRTPFLDGFFSLVTYLGSELVFMLLAVATYWCVSKSRGLYLLSVGYFGTVLNQFLKIACRVPRPWVKDPGFTIVESARAGATGYSFPSGHTQNAVGTFGSLAMGQKPWVQAVLWGLAGLTALSRMYLGVHTPADVLVSAVLALALVFGLRPLFRDIENHPRRVTALFALMAVLTICYGIFVRCWRFPADLDADNYAHALENAAKLLGALCGLIWGYLADLKWVRFETKAPLPGQVLKVVLGLGLVVVLKEGLKPILGTGQLADFLRYGLMVFFAAGIWPMTFKWFAKIGK